MFSRPYDRTVITRPGECRCRARAAYRLWPKGADGRGAVLVCPACAAGYDNAKYEHEALPHIRRAFDEMLYEGYVHNRATYTPEQLAELFTSFKGRVEEFEARYQAEAGKRAAS